jgi:tetratricopeptide (TPR) repeat protein
MGKRLGNTKVRNQATLAAATRVAMLLVFAFMILSAGRSGYARLLSAYAARSLQASVADTAVQFSPNDAQNHLIYGGVFQANGDFSSAVAQYSRAVSLRPDDYVLWLNLSHARELTGDKEGALSAAASAVALAPHYTKPHWQLGNLLIRDGRIEDGFSELRLATAHDPVLQPAIIDLAWQVFGGNVPAVLKVTDPRSPQTHKALADYFRRRGRTAEAIAMFEAAAAGGGKTLEPDRRGFLAELLDAKKFNEAFSLWTIAHPRGSGGSPLFDPGFEQESDLDEPGFGWRGGKQVDEIHLSLDPAEAGSGRFSLQVAFNGRSDAAQPVVSQFVVAAPRTAYQLRFAARTLEIVSGGLPGIVVVDAGSGQVLGQSGPLPQTSAGWHDYRFDFTTTENTEAIQIRLQRGACGGSCPIFGRLWLDRFELQKS